MVVVVPLSTGVICRSAEMNKFLIATVNGEARNADSLPLRWKRAGSNRKTLAAVEKSTLFEIFLGCFQRGEW